MGIMRYHEVNLIGIAVALNTLPFPVVSFLYFIFSSPCNSSDIRLTIFVVTAQLYPGGTFVRLPQNKCRKVRPE